MNEPAASPITSVHDVSSGDCSNTNSAGPPASVTSWRSSTVMSYCFSASAVYSLTVASYGVACTVTKIFDALPSFSKPLTSGDA
jgi:hypothetical protein